MTYKTYYSSYCLLAMYSNRTGFKTPFQVSHACPAHDCKFHMRAQALSNHDESMTVWTGWAISGPCSLNSNLVVTGYIIINRSLQIESYQQPNDLQDLLLFLLLSISNVQ